MDSLLGMVTLTICEGFSDVYEGTVDPSWRQTFFLYVRDPDQQSLELHVEHVGKNREEGNPVLGSATFSDLKGICDGKIHDLSLDLEGCAALHEFNL